MIHLSAAIFLSTEILVFAPSETGADMNLCVSQHLNHLSLGILKKITLLGSQTAVDMPESVAIGVE